MIVGLFYKRIVVTTTGIKQPHWILSKRIELMKSLHRNLRKRVNFHRQAKHFRQSLNLNIISPLSIPALNLTILLQIDRHIRLKEPPLLSNISHTILPEPVMVFLAAIQLVREGPEQAVAVPCHLENGEAPFLEGLTALFAAFLDLGGQSGPELLFRLLVEQLGLACPGGPGPAPDDLHLVRFQIHPAVVARLIAHKMDLDFSGLSLILLNDYGLQPPARGMADVQSIAH